MSEAQKIQLAKGNSPFTYELSSTGEWDETASSIWSEDGESPAQNWVWYSHRPDRSYLGKTFEFKPTIRFMPKEGTIDFRECWSEKISGKTDVNKTMAARLCLVASKFVVKHCGPSDDDDTSYTIELQVLESEENIGEVTLSDVLSIHAIYEDRYRDLHRIQAGGLLRELRHVRMTFNNYKGNKFFDVDAITKVVHGQGRRTVSDEITVFYSKQQEAFAAECDLKKAKVEALRRDNCTVQVSASTQNSFRLSLHIRSVDHHDDWAVEIGATLLLRANSVFLSEAPVPDADSRKGWTANVVSIHAGHFIALVNNPITNIGDYLDVQVLGVQASVIDPDPLVDRMHNALVRMQSCMRHEYGQMSAAELVEKPWADLHVPFSRLFLKHEDSSSSGRLAMDLRTGGSNITFQAGWLLKPSHMRVINNVVKSRLGVTGCQGPPGTGKTSLASKVAAFCLTQCNLDGSVVMTAHSNQATLVLLEKCHQHFDLFGLKALDHVVHVETPGRLQRRKDFGHNTSPVLESYALETQLMRLAMTDFARYGDYVTYHTSYISKTLEGLELKKYLWARGAVTQKLRDTRTVFVCTVSTLYTNFFATPHVQGGRNFKCALWIIDEASQCPIPAFVEPWVSQNPKHILICGDSKQLPAFAISEQARITWNHGPMYHVELLGEDVCVMLDIQFRMTQHSYHPTSVVHYKGRVSTPALSGGRDYAHDLLSKIRRIEIDPQGYGEWMRLHHDFIVFDLLDGAQMPACTSSSANRIEARIVQAFLMALHKAGVPWADIMALTPYEGQYQLFLDMQKVLGAVDLAPRKIGSSQGSEKPIVVFSPVKTDMIGYMASGQRQNVTTSRHKAGFFLVGSLRTLMQGKAWKQWMAAVDDANAPLGKYHYKITAMCKFRVASDYVVGTQNHPTTVLPVRTGATPPSRAPVPTSVAPEATPLAPRPAARPFAAASSMQYVLGGNVSGADWMAQAAKASHMRSYSSKPVSATKAPLKPAVVTARAGPASRLPPAPPAPPSRPVAPLPAVVTADTAITRVNPEEGSAPPLVRMSFTPSLRESKWADQDSGKSESSRFASLKEEIEGWSPAKKAVVEMLLEAHKEGIEAVTMMRRFVQGKLSTEELLKVEKMHELARKGYK